MTDNTETNNMRFYHDDVGYVELVDLMGDDQRIVDAARVSYQEATKRIRTDAGLLDYLIRHKHSSPLEFVQFTFRIKMPIYLIRQLIKHRAFTQSEESARYSESRLEFEYPHNYRGQSAVNRQVGDKELDRSVQDSAAEIVESTVNYAANSYKELLEIGVAREQARMVLPVNAYSTFFWRADARNLMHYLNLRLEEGAQKEHRDYAQMVKELVTPFIPLTVAAFENHVFNAITLSGHEIDFIRDMQLHPHMSDGEIMGSPELPYTALSKGAKRELLEKIDKLGLAR